eukprot:9192307-Pyramimonas_sp.AAC.1
MCCAPQQPSIVATVSEIAAPQGRRGVIRVCGEYPVRWAPQQPSKAATVSQTAAPRDGEV